MSDSNQTSSHSSSTRINTSGSNNIRAPSMQSLGQGALQPSSQINLRQYITHFRRVSSVVPASLQNGLIPQNTFNEQMEDFISCQKGCNLTDLKGYKTSNLVRNKISEVSK